MDQLATEPQGQRHPSREHSNLSYPTGRCFAQGRSCKSSYLLVPGSREAQILVDPSSPRAHLGWTMSRSTRGLRTGDLGCACVVSKTKCLAGVSLGLGTDEQQVGQSQNQLFLHFHRLWLAYTPSPTLLETSISRNLPHPRSCPSANHYSLLPHSGPGGVGQMSPWTTGQFSELREVAAAPRSLGAVQSEEITNSQASIHHGHHTHPPMNAENPGWRL